MKKKITATVITVIAALFIFAGGVYAGTTYIEWKGSPSYRATLENINLFEQHDNEREQELNDLISQKDSLVEERDNLLTDNENISRDNEQLNNQVLDLENKINALEQDILALEERIADGQTTRDQLGQAEKDMNHLEERSTEVLEGLE